MRMLTDHIIPNFSLTRHSTGIIVHCHVLQYNVLIKGTIQPFSLVHHCRSKKRKKKVESSSESDSEGEGGSGEEEGVWVEKRVRLNSQDAFVGPTPEIKVQAASKME